MRYHTSSPKVKVQNLISSNSVEVMYLPAIRLANTNIHLLLNPGQLPTTALPKRLSRIFLWEEFSRRDPILIVNTFLYTDYIFGGRWGAHSYLDSP